MVLYCILRIFLPCETSFQSRKRAKQSEKRRLKNLRRTSAIKSATRKVVDALEKGENIEETKKLMRDVEAQLARAKSKHVVHAKTASRKVSRLAKKVAAAEKAQK